MAFVGEDWWYEDKDGRRIGWLYPEDFTSIVQSFYGGNRRWAKMFARDCGLSYSQVDRWRNGGMPIPKYIAVLVSMRATMTNAKIPYTPVEAPYLPDVEGTNGKLGSPVTNDID